MATGNVESITYDRAMDHNPTWSPDGDKLYFASDRTGIFNIYGRTPSTIAMTA